MDQPTPTRPRGGLARCETPNRQNGLRPEVSLPETVNEAMYLADGGYCRYRLTGGRPERGQVPASVTFSPGQPQ